MIQEKISAQMQKIKKKLNHLEFISCSIRRLYIFFLFYCNWGLLKIKSKVPGKCIKCDTLIAFFITLQISICNIESNGIS